MKQNTSKPLVVIQCYVDRQQTLPLRRVENVSNGVSNSVAQNLPNGVTKNALNSVVKNLTNGIPNGVTKNAMNGVAKSLQNGIVNNDPQPKREATDNPPPPPPMPSTNGIANGHHNGNCKVAEILNQIPTQSDLKAPNFRKNGVLTRTPTPDYNNKLDTTVRKIKEDKAELDSLESYKLKNPSNAPPKPPSNYFVRAPNGTATMKKHNRPVSVTIGEYAYNGASRRDPIKLEFLNSDKPDGPQPEANDETSISNRLQSELVLTLSRSNLRKKTEALADADR